jgi:AcrR family transcriptional regulator
LSRGTLVVLKRRTKRRDPAQPERRLRADAALNRARILDAAEHVFAQHGAAASTELVAKHAGVGIGTIFRHFPTKEALLQELLRTRLAMLAAQADTLAPDEDAIFQFFARFVEQASRKQAVVATLARAGIDVQTLMADAGRQLRAAVTRLLMRPKRQTSCGRMLGSARCSDFSWVSHTRLSTAHGILVCSDVRCESSSMAFAAEPL